MVTFLLGDYHMEAYRVVDDELVTAEIIGETELSQNDIFTVTLDGDGISVA